MNTLALVAGFILLFGFVVVLLVRSSKREGEAGEEADQIRGAQKREEDAREKLSKPVTGNAGSLAARWRARRRRVQDDHPGET